MGNRLGPILAVEDMPANLALLHAVLEPAGFDLRDATSLAQARRELEEHPPLLVLLDVRLPDGDGLELAREMRRGERAKHVPILAISASVLPHERADAQAAGCDAFLAKPIRPAELLTSIRSLLGADAQETTPSL